MRGHLVDAVSVSLVSLLVSFPFVLLPRHQWSHIDPQCMIDFESMQCLQSWEIRTSGVQKWLQVPLLRIIWAFSDRSVTHTRSSPEWECEPDDRQSHHVFPHWVVEALQEVKIDLKDRPTSVIFFIIIYNELLFIHFFITHSMYFCLYSKEKLGNGVARLWLHFHQFIQLLRDLDPVDLWNRDTFSEYNTIQ